ncbi:ANTAR domain-containing protein [Streptomyces sp. NPDC102270]|uniref:ANTAR domain-containing protein n=1 Tax=Streptomyces sp. NPDC102270 TaxID=3366150 RepID=UPI00380AB24E
MAFPDGGWADASTAAHLQQALRRHCVINQAVGIVMAQRHRTSAQARETLRATARDRRLTFFDVCTDLVAGFGRPPRDPPDPSPRGPRP